MKLLQQELEDAHKKMVLLMIVVEHYCVMVARMMRPHKCCS